MSAPHLLIVDPQRIFADPASDWASPFWGAAWERIRELAAHVGPERTLVSRLESAGGVAEAERAVAEINAGMYLVERDLLVDARGELAILFAEDLGRELVLATGRRQVWARARSRLKLIAERRICHSEFICVSLPRQ